MDNTYYQGKKAEREAVAFVNQLVEDMGGLKKHLRNLQDKCEGVDSKLRPVEFQKGGQKVERLKVSQEKSVKIVGEERNQERKEKYWSSPQSLKPIKPMSLRRGSTPEVQQENLLKERKEKSYMDYASVSFKASDRTVEQYQDGVKSFKTGKARDKLVHKQEMQELKEYQKGISGSRKEARQLSNALSGWVEQPEGEDIDGKKD